MAELKFDITKMAEGFAKAAKERGMFVGKWIPVETALPEDHKDVLIYLSSDQICIGCYNSHRLPFSNNVIGWGANYVYNWCSNDVVAWMPMPTPPNKSEIPTGQIVANGELYPGEFDDPLAEERSEECTDCVLDKIRVEIEALPKTYPFVNHYDMYVKEDDVKKIIDRFRKER